MKLFQQKTQVVTFTNCKEMVDFFLIGENDFILGSKSIYQTYFAKLCMGADVLFKGDYGNGEPTDEMIDAIISDFRKKEYKRVFAIGGGGVIDIAKLLVIENATTTEALFEKKIPFVKARELIAVPTTCGAGSEVSNISIAELKKKNTKYGLAEDALYPDYAVLLPELLESLPYPFFVTSAIDGLIHGMESYLSPRSNGYTELFAVKAMELYLKGMGAVVAKGKEHRLHILEEFLTASNYAGIAFGNTGTGAVHALSYPLGGVYHVTHGEANYQMLGAVLKVYKEKMPTGKIKKLEKLVAGALGCEEATAFDQMEGLMNALVPLNPLKKYGMRKEEVTLFTDSVIKSQQRLLCNSYIPLSKEDIFGIYERRYEK